MVYYSHQGLNGLLQSSGIEWFTITSASFRGILIEPRSEKTGLRGFRPGPTQTGLYSH